MDRQQFDAAEAFARALRTGELSAARTAAAGLADDATFDANGVVVSGRDAIHERLRGQWPLTPALARGVWSPPAACEGGAKIAADFSSLGAAPRDYTLTFAFSPDGAVSRVEERYTFPSKADPVALIPPHVRSAINRALANGTPIVVSYVGDDGYPALSLRGSVQVSGDLELCAWLRSATGGLVRAVEAGRPLSLLYRDSATRTTLIIRGRGHIARDAARRDRVYALAPEVEQTHDPARAGAALLIAVERIAGTSPAGPVLVEG